MKKRLIPLLLAAALLAGCGAGAEYKTEFFAMDTVMQMTLYGVRDAQELARDVIAEVSALEDELSVTREDSSLARLNRGEALVPEQDLRELLSRTEELGARTGGCLDASIYPIVKLWGFTTGSYRVPGEAERTQALESCGMEHLHREGDTLRLDDGSALDFGAVAKGYAAEQCAALLAAAGGSGILTLGGNIQTVGTKPDGSAWRIGVTDPDRPEESIAVLTLEGSSAVVTSGGYQRYFEQDGVRYSHIMDPFTGASVQNDLRSVTVVAGSGFLADGLSTALYVMGSTQAEEFWRASDDFELVLITDSGILVSEGLENRFSCTQPYEVMRR